MTQAKTRWLSRTRRDLIIEVWEALDCESVGRSELEQIQKELSERFGEGGVDSPAAIARTVADEGAVLRHPEVFECDYDWRVRQLDNAESLGELRFSTLAEAVASFAKLEEARLQQVDGDPDWNKLQRRMLAVFEETHLAAQSRLLTTQERAEAAEIGEWISVWLKSPQLFTDWLELRMRSPQFQKQFPQSTQP